MRTAMRAATLAAVTIGVLAAVCSTLVTPARPAGAQVVEPTLTLVSQPFTVEADGSVPFVLHLEGDVPADAELTFIGFRRVGSRATVQQAIEVEGGRTVDIVSLPLAAVARNEEGDLVVELGTESNTRDPFRLLFSLPGLYPVLIDVRVGGEPFGGIVTFVERLPEAPPPVKTLASLLVHVDGAPTRQPTGGSIVPDEVRAELTTLAELLERSPVPITVVIRPELLDGLARTEEPADAELLARLAAAIDDRHELLAEPFVAMNPSAALAGGLRDEFTEQLRVGEDIVEDRLPGVIPDRTTWLVADGLGTEGLDLLRDLGVRRLAVDDKAAGSSSDGSGVLASVEATDEDVPAIASDPAFEAALASVPSDPVATAHQLYAELVGMGIEDEAFGADDPDRPQRGLIVGVGTPTELDSPFLDALFPLLESSPYVDVVSVGDMMRKMELGTGDNDVRSMRLTVPDTSVLEEVGPLLGRVEEGVRSTETMLPIGDPHPAHWDDLLAVLPAENLPDRQRRAYVTQLDGEVGDLRSAVSVVLDTGTINLGGRRSEIPVQLVNESTTPLRVMLRLVSPKLQFPEGDQIIELVGRQRLEIPVEARTNGRFPVTVQLLTPDGSSELTAPQTLTVQATALTGLGQVVTGAFVVILASWWVQHARVAHRKRRLERTASTAERHPAARPSDPTATLGSS
jgi:Family of unknown function (DUF6049)